MEKQTVDYSPLREATAERVGRELDACTGGRTYDRVLMLSSVIARISVESLDKLRIVQVGDEHTGQRYGRAARRVGRCVKLGGGGRNKGQRHAYQVWADWS
jgi:hypothetical protein